MNLFILENENQKKENIITSLKKQITKMREKEIIEIENEEDSENNNIRNNIIPNEIYIIDPSASVNLIQDDLMLYKKAYENALNKIRENTLIIDKYEVKIDELKSELYQYQNSNINKNNNNKKNNINCNIQLNDISVSDLTEIINIPDINNDELENICQNKNGIKFLVIINKYIVQLKEKINKLKKECYEMKEKLIKENNENMVLYKSIFEMKAKNAIYQSFSHRNLKPIFSENYLNTDISLIGNVDDTNHKKYRKKNYFKNQEKLNQSADDVRNLINNTYCEVKNNLTEVNVNINENEISIENDFLNKERNKNEK